MGTLGFAAAAVFLVVWAYDGLPVLMQVVLFVVLSFVSIQVYRTWFRRRARPSDRPLLNRRAEQLIGRVVVLEHPIVDGRGRVQIADAYVHVEVAPNTQIVVQKQAIGAVLPKGTLKSI